MCPQKRKQNLAQVMLYNEKEPDTSTINSFALKYL